MASARDGYAESYNNDIKIDFVLLLQKYWLLLLSVLVAGFSIGLIYIGTADEIYRAQGDLILNVPQTLTVDIPEALDKDVSAPSKEKISTELEIIRSASLLTRVIDHNDLINHPFFAFPISDKVKLTANDPRAFANPKYEYSIERHKKYILHKLESGLDANTVGASLVARVSYESTSPDVAQLVSNAVIREYIGDQVDRQSEAAERANTYLVERLQRLRAQMMEDKQKVEEVRKAEGIFDLAGIDSAERELILLNEQLVKNETELTNSRAKLNSINGIMKNGGNIEVVAQEFESETLAQLGKERAIAATKLAELRSRYGSRHPIVIDARGSMAGIDAEVRTEVQRLTKNLQASIQILEDRQAHLDSYAEQLRDQLHMAKSGSIKLNVLQAQADISEKMYETFLSRSSELQNPAMAEADARVLVWAALPGNPVHPKKPLILALSIVASLTIAVIAVLVMELLNRGFASIPQIERELRLMVLGSIPQQTRIFNMRRFRQIAPTTYMMQNSGSYLSRSFRRLFDNLAYQFDHTTDDRGGRIVTITSSIQGEGKTTSAVCLARTAALRGTPTLLIDCDMWRPGLTNSTSLNKKAGLAELLNTDRDFVDYIYKEGLPKKPNYGLHVLPAGRDVIRRKSQLDERRIFTNPRFAELLAWARTRYQLIVIDTPPILAVSDVRDLCRLADLTVLAIRHKATPKAIVESSIRELEMADVAAPRILLSRVDTHHVSSYAALGTGGYHKYISNYLNP